jgi:hypothetical protein
MTDELQPMAANDSVEAESEEGDSTDERVERILAHVDDSLGLDDPLQASVGAASGDLMLMQYRLCQMLDEMLQQPPDTLTALAEVMPAFNTYMKVSQQVDRFIQLSLKIKTAKGASRA